MKCCQFSLKEKENEGFCYFSAPPIVCTNWLCLQVVFAFKRVLGVVIVYFVDPHLLSVIVIWTKSLLWNLLVHVWCSRGWSYLNQYSMLLHQPSNLKTKLLPNYLALKSNTIMIFSHMVPIIQAQIFNISIKVAFLVTMKVYWAASVIVQGEQENHILYVYIKHFSEQSLAKCVKL